MQIRNTMHFICLFGCSHFLENTKPSSGESKSFFIFSWVGSVSSSLLVDFPKKRLLLFWLPVPICVPDFLLAIFNIFLGLLPLPGCPGSFTISSCFLNLHHIKMPFYLLFSAPSFTLEAIPFSHSLS